MQITSDMIVKYAELVNKKKEVDDALEEFKKVFNDYFDLSVGRNEKGEIALNGLKLQRQIRKIDKYDREKTVKRLEELNQHQLIQKTPDEKKIKSALDLEILDEKDLSDCKLTNYTKAIYVKPV
ncbi:hypothetical protein ACUXCC_002991 [Cytobacillus horneckiae]|uniref:Uncharacterized protein n=1 Tax=Cytobacillus horneckiae TaxID=549687 RepID=A0A2N0ZEM1_9BACI|nr:hypothetical protein [Cytobacillus horneckiae]MBN6888076.1 hypothetical protein [Cytobacillus horneckiae]MCM3176931.1 hypothetical protein [Cytobacillus horneckiae]MEC1154631.1 hypothetical protein [Cytobacillus horneckiae]MED2938972.1 hypothetical protein [Cytobacillus horneckiae]PKG27948.1 hypothetical protein CWS20_16315 [Cytobacillus horneckiae]